MREGLVIDSSVLVKTLLEKKKEIVLPLLGNYELFCICSISGG